MKCPGGLRGQLGGFLLLYSITVSAAMPPDTATLRYNPGLDSLLLNRFLQNVLQSSHILGLLSTPRSLSKHPSVVDKNKVSGRQILSKGSMVVAGTNSVNIVATNGSYINSNHTRVKVATMQPLVLKLTTRLMPVSTTTPKTITTRISSTVINRKKILSTTVTTDMPFRLKVTKPNEYINGTSKIPAYIKLTTPTKRKTPVLTTMRPKSKKKPTIHKIISKWSETPDVYEIKQNWYEEGVPYPNPNPEIYSPSPGVSLDEVSSVTPSLDSQMTAFSDLVSNGAFPSVSPMPEVSSYSPQYSIGDTISSIAPNLESASQPAANSNPISVFNLDMIPEATKLGEGVAGAGSPCPTVHISSSLFGVPQQRQASECSDLNLVLNSHIYQNSGDTRNPSPSTYDANSPGGSAAETGASGTRPAADPGVAADEAAAPADAAAVGAPQDAAADGAAPAAADPAANAAAPPAASSGGTGGSGGSGGDGGDGDGGQWKFPDLKGLFEALGYLWRILGHLLSFLKNPYLYIVPMAMFFLLGFIKVMALFPWWIPLLMFYVGLKSVKPVDRIAVYKHVHKPVYHPDGWFWNHQTKTWQNVAQVIHKKKDDVPVDSLETRIDNILNHGYEDKLHSKAVPTKKDIYKAKDHPVDNIEDRINKLLNSRYPNSITNKAGSEEGQHADVVHTNKNESIYQRINKLITGYYEGNPGSGTKKRKTVNR